MEQVLETFKLIPSSIVLTSGSLQVANVSDRAYLGPGVTLTHLSPLLRLKAENPHATIITLFLNAVHEMRTEEVERSSITEDMKKAAKYLPPLTMADISRGKSSTVIIRMVEARMMFWDYDSLFQSYMDGMEFDKISWLSGTVVKEENTIVDAWPMRLKNDPSQEEFDHLHASGHNGSERYVEWKGRAHSVCHSRLRRANREAVGNVDRRMLAQMMSELKFGDRRG